MTRGASEKTAIPVPGGHLPRRGNRFSRWLGRSILHLFGWRIEGEFPNRGKFLAIVAPHTSNWDFVIGIAAVLALGIEAHWLGKHTLFCGPVGPLMRRLGGIAVDRRSPQGYIDQLAGIFERRERFILGITPEGTRRRVERWKTGFYHIAKAAGVPLVPCYLDFKRRVAGIGPAWEPDADLTAEMQRLEGFFRDIAPKRPQNFNRSIHG